MPANSADLLKGEHLNEIIHSDVGVEALLSRLKQSIYSSKEFAQFVKKLAVLESEHAQQLKKTSRSMNEVFRRPEIPKGTFQSQILDIVRTNERLGDAGNNFIDSMHKIHEEISEIVKNIDRQRKLEKETALRNEKNLVDAEQLAEKAKGRYDSAADDFERARSGDPQKKLGLRQKSEEELQKKMTVAEMDYQQKVDQAQRLRRETENRHRVESVKKIKDLILESDQALVLQVTRFANLNEALQLNRGFVLAPIKPANAPRASQGIKEMASKIDPQLDLYNYILDIPKVKKYLNRQPVSFVKHAASGSGAKISSSVGVPAMTPTAAPGGTRNFTPQVRPAAENGDIPAPSRLVSAGTAKSGPVLAKGGSSGPSGAAGAVGTIGAIGAASATEPSASGYSASGAANTSTSTSASAVGGSSSFGGAAAASPPSSTGPATAAVPELVSSVSSNSTSASSGLSTFGSPLEKLLVFEDSTVPRVVYQCVQAIDNFGLEVEGIYRQQGSAQQVTEIKRLFDQNAAGVDLLRPSKSLNDIHSVASALKLYFKELPDPLLTREHNDEFLSAVKIPDLARRRDTVHSIINMLPDANYTTLRYLVFHLFRVQELHGINKMGIDELSIVWGPLLMSADYSNTGEVPAQATIVSIILSNAYAIFDAE